MIGLSKALRKVASALRRASAGAQVAVFSRLGEPWRCCESCDETKSSSAGPAFLACISSFLCPTLQPGDIVLADNLSAYKIAGVRAPIEAAGATLRYLPSYSPDLNSIERVFSKLKALPRRAARVSWGCSSGMRSAAPSIGSRRRSVPAASRRSGT